MSIAGKYDHVSNENYDEYLKAVGVGMIKRSLANKLKPTFEFIDNGNNKWTQKTLTSLKNLEITFTLGEEFDETTPDDRQAKSIVTLEGNKMTHTQRIGDGVSTTVRVFNGDEMVATHSAKGVVATRKFKKVA